MWIKGLSVFNSFFSPCFPIQYATGYKVIPRNITYGDLNITTEKVRYE